LQDATANGQGFEGTDEYDPAGDDRTDLPQHAPQVKILSNGETEQPAPRTEIRIVRWAAEEKDLTVTSSQPVKLAIRLLDYPAWRIEVNARPVTPQHTESTAQMILPLSPGTNRITARFTRTPDNTVGDVFSMAAGAMFLVLMLSSYKIRR